MHVYHRVGANYNMKRLCDVQDAKDGINKIRKLQMEVGGTFPLGVPHSFYDKNGEIPTIYTGPRDPRWNIPPKDGERIVIVSTTFSRINILINRKVIELDAILYGTRMIEPSVMNPTNKFSHYHYKGLTYYIYGHIYYIHGHINPVIEYHPDFNSNGIHTTIIKKGIPYIRFSTNYTHHEKENYPRELNLKWLYIAYLLDYYNIPHDVMRFFGNKTIWSLPTVNNQF